MPKRCLEFHGVCTNHHQRGHFPSLIAHVFSTLCTTCMMLNLYDIPIQQCTRYTNMSKDNLLFSFAHFFELKFYFETYHRHNLIDGKHASCTVCRAGIG